MHGSEGRGAGDGSMVLEGGDLEAAAQLWRVVRRRQRGSGGRGVGSIEAAVRLQRAGRRRQRGSGG